MKTCKICQSVIDEKGMKCCYCQTYQWNKPKLHSFLIVILGFLMLVSVSNIGSQFRIGGNRSVALAASLKPQRRLELAKKAYPHFSGNGTFRVGKDIQPGTYRTRAATSGCYYARLRGFSGSLNEIIANEITDTPAIVTIAAKDKGFQTSNCSTWTKDLSAITKNKTTFRDGNYIVGTDIKPGTYRTRVASSGCYYARLRGFGGTLDEIITNNITNGSAIVTIAAKDQGFQATNCGTWTKA